MDLTVILKIALVGLITAVIGMVLKRAGKEEFATVVSIAGLLVALVMLADMVAGLYDSVKNLFGI